MIGVRFKNDRGSMQIDNRYANLALGSHFQIATNAAPDPYGHGTGSRIALSASRSFYRVPIFAVRCADHFALIPGASSNGDEWYYTVYCSGPVGTVVDVYAFTTPWDLGSGVGMRIRRPDGETITFDSRHRYLRVAGSVRRAPEDGPTTIAYPEGRTYALATSRFDCVLRQAVVATGPVTAGSPHRRYWYEYTGARSRGNLIDLAAVDGESGYLYPANVLAAQPARSAGADFLIIDVTHY